MPKKFKKWCEHCHHTFESENDKGCPECGSKNFQYVPEGNGNDRTLEVIGIYSAGPEDYGIRTNPAHS